MFNLMRPASFGVVGPIDDLSFDPYRRCPDMCVHDLGRGVLTSDLLSDSDGPDTRFYEVLFGIRNTLGS